MCVVDPVGCEKAAESRYEDDTAVVFDGASELGDFGRVLAEAEVVFTHCQKSVLLCTL